MKYPEYEVGRVVGQLTVLAILPQDYHKDRKTRYLCRCTCSKEVVVRRETLLNGKATSCGCLRKRAFDKVMERAFPSWRASARGRR